MFHEPSIWLKSPFTLEEILKTHVERYESMYLELIRKIRVDM